jgi:hypothetical protein
MTPSPDVRVCGECGWSEFSIPDKWLAAGWLHGLELHTVPDDRAYAKSKVTAIA